MNTNPPMPMRQTLGSYVPTHCQVPPPAPSVAAECKPETDAEIIAQPFEWRAEQVLSRAFGGMHHVYNLHKSPREWHTNHYGDLSTFDFNALTLLVLGAHEYCIRLSIQASGPRMVKISLWPRKVREGSFCDRHPTIEEAIVRYRNRPKHESARQGVSP